jgi:6-phosphogluconate dehydrogenase
LAFKDADGTPMVDNILDTAGQKGTGKWTGVTAMDLGIPLTLISEAVFARCLSATKEERVAASKILRGPTPKFKGDTGDRKAFIADIEKALYASKIVSYAQGYELLRAAAGEFKWDLSYGGIALLWRGGCIIRSTFLGRIKEAYDKNPKLTNLLLDPFFQRTIDAAQEGWRRVVATAATNGIWIPATATALTYYDGFRNGRLPANLLQAQRDYFGAHMYERIDKPRGQFFHTNWTGRGGTTASSAYVV